MEWLFVCFRYVVKLKFRIINFLTCNKGGSFYVWKVYVLQVYVIIVVQQPETTTAQKGLCHSCLACFVNIANYTVLGTVELSVREEITCKWQNDGFLSNKYTSLPSSISRITMNRNELWKTIRLTRFQKFTIAICFNLLQVYLSMPSFLFSLLFIHVPSFDVLQLSGYFCLTQFGDSSCC